MPEESGGTGGVEIGFVGVILRVGDDVMSEQCTHIERIFRMQPTRVLCNVRLAMN